ncbi:MAG TPA: TMEM175 family protein [Streptosporangiaceae bacterium]|nr:TMEM175 family protein [Streptosporangiaceae bacterium]
MDSRRAEAFSDGVFAVAITLLVIDLLGVGSESPLTWTALGESWPKYAAYVVSFLTIGIMWLNHHTMLANIRRVDRPTLVLNLLLLLGIVALPFPTALVAEHLTGDQHSAEVAVVVYGIWMIVISIFFASMWIYITVRSTALGGSPADRPLAAAGSRVASTLRFTGGLVGYAAGTLVALVEPVASLAIFAALAVYYLFEHLPSPADGQSGDLPDDQPDDPAAP